jgi:hypothetical protein
MGVVPVGDQFVQQGLITLACGPLQLKATLLVQGPPPPSPARRFGAGPYLARRIACFPRPLETATGAPAPVEAGQYIGWAGSALVKPGERGREERGGLAQGKREEKKEGPGDKNETTVSTPICLILGQFPADPEHQGYKAKGSTYGDHDQDHVPKLFNAL